MRSQSKKRTPTQVKKSAQKKEPLPPSLVGARLKPYFKDYASYHKTLGNQRCHLVGIPLIVVSLLGLLAQLTVPGLQWGEYLRLDGAMAFMAVVAVLYLVLDWKLAAPFFLVALGAYLIGRAVPWGGNCVLLATGWVFQGLGHRVYEKNSPAFFHHALHLLIGPFWLFGKVVGYR